MSPSCAIGSGDLPRYVAWIDRRSRGGYIRLAGATIGQTEVTCSSKEELCAQCRRLAEERYPFSIGGHGQIGPAEIMSTWQEEGLMPISFLQISWMAPGKWQLHEILPGVQQWDLLPPSELFKQPPLPVTATGRVQ